MRVDHVTQVIEELDRRAAVQFPHHRLGHPALGPPVTPAAGVADAVKPDQTGSVDGGHPVAFHNVGEP
jgi:hypothetical protein